MIRVSYWPFRLPLGTAFDVFVAAVAGLTGPGLVRLYDTTVATCASNGGYCSTALSSFNARDQALRAAAQTILLGLPAVLGMFWGAPLVARELESGTFRLAWTQGRSRMRWLGANFGIVPLGYAAFALALGITAGVVIRRTLPAMAATPGFGRPGRQRGRPEAVGGGTQPDLPAVGPGRPWWPGDMRAALDACVTKLSATFDQTVLYEPRAATGPSSGWNSPRSPPSLLPLAALSAWWIRPRATAAARRALTFLRPEPGRGHRQSTDCPLVAAASAPASRRTPGTYSRQCSWWPRSP